MKKETITNIGAAIAFTPSQAVARTFTDLIIATNKIDQQEVIEIAEGYLGKALTMWQDELVVKVADELDRRQRAAIEQWEDAGL